MVEWNIPQEGWAALNFIMLLLIFIELSDIRGEIKRRK